MQTQFGKNVLQYGDFDWYYYQTDNFDIYFYQNGKELGRYAVLHCEQYLKEIEQRIDFPLGDRMTFIIYNSNNDFRQSNFPLSSEGNNVNSSTRISGNKAFIYFNGNHFDFDVQIKAGIAQVLFDELLSGGNFQEKVQNNLLLNLPEWYSKGLVEYLSEEWNAANEDKLRNGILSGRFRKFRKLQPEEQILIGHSLWKYVSDVYGKDAISNIIYIVRSNKSLESGYMFVLGKTFNQMFDEWYAYQIKKFSKTKEEALTGENIQKLKKVFKKGTITQVSISRTGTQAAVVTNDAGLIRLWIVDLETGKKKKIYKEGYRQLNPTIERYNYPIAAWNPKQNSVTVVYEHQSLPYYFQYNIDEKKKSDKQIITRLDRILSLEYADDGKTAIFSAIRKGQTDLILFDFRSQMQKPLTDDIYDDLDPRFVNNGKGIVFSSNRPESSLKKVNSTIEYSFAGDMNIFYLPDYNNRLKTIKQLSKKPTNEILPDQYDSTWFTYLTDESGTYNLDAVRLDSIFQAIRIVAQARDTSISKNDTIYFYKNEKSEIRLSNKILNDSNIYRIDTAFIYKDTLYIHPQTDVSGSILWYQIDRRLKTNYSLVNEKSQYALLRNALPQQTIYSLPEREKIIPLKNEHKILSKPQPQGNEEIDSTSKSGKENEKTGIDYFQTEFPKPHLIPGSNTTGESESKNDKRIRYGSSIPYSRTFTIDYATTQLDNSTLYTAYIPYKKGENSISNPLLNPMLKFGLSDLFKDYRLLAGGRVLSSLHGAEYIAAFQNLSKRLDKTVIFYHRGETKPQDDITYYKELSNELRGELKWPFSEISSLRGSAFGREDRRVYLSSEKFSLTTPDQNLYWAGGKLEYVFDNTISRGINLYNGSRFKFYSEFFDALNKDKTLFSVVGTDLRTYTKLSRQVVWANRLAGATSIGSAKVVYILGGVDNWMLPHYDASKTIDDSKNYVYKSLATNMRGFDQNIRNGNTYAVLNSELRVPVFKLLFNRPFRSLFLDNFQVIGFADAGSAWSGLNLFSEENAYDVRYINNDPAYLIKVVSPRDPIVYGYGFGLRGLFLGYFMRLDWAWGIQDGQKQQKKVYFSLTTDF